MNNTSEIPRILRIIVATSELSIHGMVHCGRILMLTDEKHFSKFLQQSQKLVSP